MATTTPLQGIPLPEPTDADNVPADLAAILDVVEGRLVMRFASEAARDAAITAPESGMIAMLTDQDRISFYDGGAWRKGAFVQAGTSANRPAPSGVPEGTFYYETDTNLLKGQIGGAWVIINATGDVGGSDVDASSVVINGTEKKLHEVTIPANPDYALEAFITAYCSFGGGTTTDDLEVRLRAGSGTGGTMLSRAKDRAPNGGWGSCSVTETRTIAKGSSAADRTFSLTIVGSGAYGHTTMANPNAVGIDYIVLPKNL